jgi:hypothetical protein
MKRIFMLILLFLSYPTYASEIGENEQHDYWSLLSELLSINQDRYYYTDKKGKKINDELELFKEMDSLYTKYISPDPKTKEYSVEQIRIIMLISFYAVNRNSAAFNEYLATDLKPIFENNRELFAQSMADLPFFISSTCNRLNAHFGFEGKNISGKQEFVDGTRSYLSNYLSEEQVFKCSNEFE